MQRSGCEQNAWRWKMQRFVWANSRWRRFRLTYPRSFPDEGAGWGAAVEDARVHSREVGILEESPLTETLRFDLSVGFTLQLHGRASWRGLVVALARPPSLDVTRLRRLAASWRCHGKFTSWTRHPVANVHVSKTCTKSSASCSTAAARYNLRAEAVRRSAESGKSNTVRQLAAVVSLRLSLRASRPAYDSRLGNSRTARTGSSSRILVGPCSARLLISRHADIRWQIRNILATLTTQTTAPLSLSNSSKSNVSYLCGSTTNFHQ